MISKSKENRESTEGYSKSIVRYNNDKFGKGLVSTSRTYASPNGTGPGVRRKCSMETTQNSVKGRVRYKVWSVGGCHCIWSGHRMSFNICERENFILFDKIPVSIIKLPQWRFQAFLDVSLFEKLIWKSRRPQDKTSIRRASPGIPYKLRNKDAIGGRGWNIATQERKICDVEIEIVTFVLNGSVKLTVPPDRQK